MEYLYHAKPVDLRGTHLLPLSILRSVHTDLFERAFAKYRGRVHLTEVKLPILNCLWNEAIHLTPIDPSLIRKKLESLGLATTAKIWLKFPASAIEEASAITFEHPPCEYGEDYSFPVTSFKRFDCDDYSALSEIPDNVMQYYRSEIMCGRRPLLFNGLRHVLVKKPLPLFLSEEVHW
jgi:hypothetical protein